LPIIAKVTETRSLALNRLLNFFEAIARRAAYLALLTEYPHALERVIRMIAASDWAAKYLTQHPILLDELLDDRTLKAPADWPAFALDCQRQLDTAPGDTERQMDILREMHHAQLFRLLAQDLEGDLSVERLGRLPVGTGRHSGGRHRFRRSGKPSPTVIAKYRNLR